MTNEKIIKEKTSECPVCGGREVMTGKMEMREGQTWYEMKCEECQSVGFEWAKEWEDSIAD
ncbi:TPA: hypothetical protein DEP96_01105 [Candidatus Uhrbacteria bacterium]|nr:hypothetical protein [Candidatus Uhrbacteria bacterium]